MFILKTIFFFFQLILCIRIYNCTFSKYIYNCTIADWNSQKTFSNFNPNIALLIDIYIVISLVVLTSISPLTLRLEQISKFHVKQQWEEVASEFGIVIVFCKRIQTSWCGNSYIILLLQSNKKNSNTLLYHSYFIPLIVHIYYADIDVAYGQCAYSCLDFSNSMFHYCAEISRNA